MKIVNLIDVFDREIEVLEIKDQQMIYAMDQKDDTKNSCVIGAYDFITHEIKSLVLLDYTRIYESFQTYSQNPDFFYAVNVLDDYRVRLRKVDKKAWKVHEDILINAEGEILGLYILDDKRLLVTDEVEANSQKLKQWDVEASGRYVEIKYIYDIDEQKKYPLKNDDPLLSEAADRMSLAELDEEKDIKYLACDMDSMIKLSFREDDGEVCADGCVTAFYKEVQVKEDIEFREYVQLEYNDGRKPELFAGRCIYGGGWIVLLKSYLAL